MGGIGEKIMVSAFTGVMTSVLCKLANLMKKEYAKFKGVRKKLESLTKELIAINIMLEKYAEMENPDVQVKAWIKEVRELAYDIEDFIDLFTYHVDHEPPEKTTGFMKFLYEYIDKLKKLHHRHKFAKQIPKLHALVNEVYERQIKYKLDEGTSSNLHSEIDPRLLAHYVEVEKLVGIEGPSEELISRFVGDEPTKQLRVVSIVGPGGLGKTTLAKQVYQKIKGQFFYTAFVSVSQKPSINNLLRVLLLRIETSYASLEPMGSYSDQQLIDKLREYLEKQRYLIVIDDIWEKSAWEAIQCALPKNGHASRIITTTRINNVAESCCTSNEDFVYRMKPLSRSDSTKLFLKRTFGSEDTCPGHLEGIMDDILHKCDGLPLAILSIASLLAIKPRITEEWERVLSSIGATYEKDRELKVMHKILSLSYYDLPCDMKTCLLYLSIFPEDYEIERDCLVWRWIAEGFISSKQGYTLEEVGKNYFNELINRSLIQPLYMEFDNAALGCQVHDVVRDFILYQSIEENFVSLLDGKGLSSEPGKIHRLHLRHMDEHAGVISPGAMNLSHLRSLHLFRVVSWMPSLVDLQVLRVLDVKDCPSWENGHLDNIGNLFHLRYLRLSMINVTKLPVQIGKLEFLQSIDLREVQVVELPESIVQLKKLMRLVGDGIILPDGFGNMEALQELWNLDGCNSSTNFGQDLQNLRQLRELGVVFRSLHCSVPKVRMEALVSSICKLGELRLRSLYIRNDSKLVDIDWLMDSCSPPPRLLQKFVIQCSEDSFSRFPKWINPLLLSDLTYLHFSVKRMEGQDLRMLTDLSALLLLHLTVWETPEGGLRIGHSGFPCLTNLHFYDRCGPGLTFEGGAMAKLKKLFLAFDAHKAHSTYGDLGFGIQHLSSLNHINVEIGYMREHTTAMKAAESVINDEVKLLPNHLKRTIWTKEFLENVEDSNPF